MRRTRLFFIGFTLVAASAGSQTLFSEDWDDGNGASRWSTPIVALETPSFGFDGSVDYNFDYSTLGAASAPNSVGGTTTGVFMEVNTTDSGFDEGETVGIIPLGFTLPDTDFRFTTDMYLFWNGGAGSTEYGTVGVHHSGSGDVPGRSGISTGDGVAWQVDTDGDSGTDLFRFEGPGGEFGLGEWEDFDDGTVPGVPTGTAAEIGPFNRWVEMSITSTDGTVEFAINGFVIDTFDNTGGAFTGGTILIAHSDPFDSVNVGDPSNGAVFDNILVTSLGGIPGDFDGDGDVDVDDFGVFANSFLLSPQGGPPFALGDFNEDGDVDVDDFGVFTNGFLMFPPQSGVAVPEPGGAVLLLIGLAASWRRRE